MRLFILFILIGVCAVSCNRNNKKTKKSAIDVTSKIYLGKVDSGTKQQFTVQCINNNAYPVKLKDVNVSCSCLRLAERYSNKIQPRDTAFFQFEYIPEGNGYIEKKIELYFDDTRTPQITKISAHVRDTLLQPSTHRSME